MRQKPANEVAVNKLIAFIQDLEFYYNPENATYGMRGISEIIKNNKVSKSTSAACKEIGILTNKDGKLVFNATYPDGRSTALLVLDNLLHRHKKTPDVPLFPDFATIGKVLGNIADKLNILTVQHENALKVLKNGFKPEPELTTDLFAYQQQYHDDFVKVATSIAGGVYNLDTMKFILNRDTPSFESTNVFIIDAAKDLLDKINNVKSK